VAWLAPPEFEVGAEPVLKPPELLELLELLEPESLEPEPVLPELVLPEPVELELLPELVPVEPEPEFAELEPVLAEEELVLAVDPGRARASAPAVTTLAMVTAVVVDRTLARPRSLAATAWRIPSSRRALLMPFILRSRFGESLHEPSGRAMSLPGPACPPAAEGRCGPRGPGAGLARASGSTVGAAGPVLHSVLYTTRHCHHRAAGCGVTLVPSDPAIGHGTRRKTDPRHTCPSGTGPFDTNAAFMLFQRHDRGIHVV
jgi:hypothetical protein